MRRSIMHFICRMFGIKKGEMIPKYLYPITFLFFPFRTLLMIEGRPLKYTLSSDSLEVNGFRISLQFLEMLTEREVIIKFTPDNETKQIVCKLIERVK